MELLFELVPGLLAFCGGGFIAGVAVRWTGAPLSDYEQWRKGFEDHINIYARNFGLDPRATEFTLKFKDHLNSVVDDKEKFLETELAIAKIIYGTTRDSE